MSSDIIFTDAVEAKEVKTTCPYCGVGCGIKATIANNQIISVKGDTSHPANLGRLCVKGSSLSETQGQNERILNPTVNGKKTSWDIATSHVADKFQEIINEHDPESIAFYLSGQLLTEDYYVANKLMKGFIGSSHVDTNSRLCMASASAAHKRAFGEDLVPGCYEDLEKTDVIFMVGSNAAYAHPIVYQRIIKAQKNNPQLKLVVIDPRATATSDTADLHIALKPGTDAYYYNGLLMYLADNDKLNSDFIAQNTQGFEKALNTARTQLNDITAVAVACDIELSTLIESYQLFANNKKVVTMFSQGINQSSTGVDKGNALINCHLATGKIGYEGAGPFSITGQPNAMGGREVGGLSTQIAAHLHYEDPGAIDLVERFWQAPNMTTKQGYKAVDMFQAIDEGKIKAIWIMATNPVVSMPNANFVKQALKKCDLVVVNECFENTDTVKCADVVFPATTWGEKYGTVTNSERRITLQKPLLTPPGQAKHDWDIICNVAKKLGFEEAFNYQHQSDIFREHAGLSGFENTYSGYKAEEISDKPETPQGVSRFFDISAYANITKSEYEAFKPIQWPVNKQHPTGVARLFTDNIFNHESGKANIISVLGQLPKKAPKADQLIMNTGRIRDQWHTMTRTGRTAKLMSHADEPFIQIHPQDAKRFNIADKQIAQLNNLDATFLGRVQYTEQQRIGEIFTPIHWNDNFSAAAKVSALVNPITDAICGQPEFKHSPVKISPFNAVWSGCLITYKTLKVDTDYWTKIRASNSIKYILSDTGSLPTDEMFLKALLPDIDDWVVMKDDKSESIRIAGFQDNKLLCFFNASTNLNEKYSTKFIEENINQTQSIQTRFKLLAGVDSDAEDIGAIVCSCFQIGENSIKASIAAGSCNTVEELGKQLKCGTNCGSCIPELKAYFT